MTTDDMTMVCTVCQKHKAQLHPRKSALKPDLQMYVCSACLMSKKEPRWLVILVGQRDGIETVREYLLNHAYNGNEITGADLVKTKSLIET